MKWEFRVPCLRRGLLIHIYWGDFWLQVMNFALILYCMYIQSYLGAIFGGVVIRELLLRLSVEPLATGPEEAALPSSLPAPQSETELPAYVVGNQGEEVPLDTRTITVVCRGEPSSVFLTPYWETGYRNFERNYGIRVQVRRVTIYFNWEEHHKTLIKVTKKANLSHEEIWEALIAVRELINPNKICYEEFWEHEPETEVCPPAEYLESAESLLAQRDHESYFNDTDTDSPY